MKILEDIILSFDIHKRLTESAAYPLVAYGVINYISARELHEYFTENGLKVSLSSVQNWRRNAATTLGLNPSGKGRQSFSVLKTQREEWHKLYGYPTIKMLMDGWSIRTSTPQIPTSIYVEPQAETPSESEGVSVHKSAQKLPMKDDSESRFQGVDFSDQTVI